MFSPHPKFISLVKIGVCQGDLKFSFRDRRELRKNMISRSILIPLFVIFKNPILRKGRKYYLFQIRGPKRSLFVPHLPLSHLEGTMRTLVQWRVRSFTRGRDYSRTNFRPERTLHSLFRNCWDLFAWEETNLVYINTSSTSSLWKKEQFLPKLAKNNLLPLLLRSRMSLSAEEVNVLWDRGYS